MTRVILVDMSNRQTPITDQERELAEAVRRATDALAEARSRRDAYIRDRAAVPRTNISDLAHKFDLSREATYKILRKATR